jgi:ribonuclease Z
MQMQVYFDRLRHASAFMDTLRIEGRPSGPGLVDSAPGFAITALHLDHRVETLGWRIAEPAGRRMLPEALAAAGVHGADIGRLQREGALHVDGRTVHLEEVSAPRPGQVMAFIMDTAWCDAAVELARDADLVVCEATYLSAEAALADAHRHLTAAQAAEIAARAGARRLVLTHFSERYADLERFAEEAGAIFPDVVVARDLDRIPVPPRREVT